MNDPFSYQTLVLHEKRELVIKQHYFLIFWMFAFMVLYSSECFKILWDLVLLVSLKALWMELQADVQSSYSIFTLFLYIIYSSILLDFKWAAHNQIQTQLEVLTQTRSWSSMCSFDSHDRKCHRFSKQSSLKKANLKDKNCEQDLYMLMILYGILRKGEGVKVVYVLPFYQIVLDCIWMCYYVH